MTSGMFLTALLDNFDKRLNVDNMTTCSLIDTISVKKHHLANKFILKAVARKSSLNLSSNENCCFLTLMSDCAVIIDVCL